MSKGVSGALLSSRPVIVVTKVNATSVNHLGAFEDVDESIMEGHGCLDIVGISVIINMFDLVNLPDGILGLGEVMLHCHT